MRHAAWVTLTIPLLTCLAACSDTPLPPAPRQTLLRPSGAVREEGEVALDVPLSGLSAAELARFNQGRAVFQRVFSQVDGLGPLFNEASCAECHEDPSVGGTGDEVETHASVVSAGGQCSDLAAQGGFVIQQHTTQLLFDASGLTAEPEPPHPGSPIGFRTTPAFFGFGFLDAVPDATILALADPNDANGDGISGRVHRTPDGRIGRFGRKGQGQTLLEFNAGAFQNEMGVTNFLGLDEPLVSGQNYPVGNANHFPDGVDRVIPEPELSEGDVRLATDFVRFLAVPPQGPKSAASNDGRDLFTSTGCASCHVPSLKTGPSPVAALSNKTFAAFTDLLLHDMGPGLADICLGDATKSEFRTEPLMGVHFRQKFLHDGRAATLDAAITAHGGEGQKAADMFIRLKSNQRAALVAYLNTL
jgi:CxxC motif-containing protein (DUF1111 family)